jgi:hypothetical protein
MIKQVKFISISPTVFEGHYLIAVRDLVSGIIFTKTTTDSELY